MLRLCFLFLSSFRLYIYTFRKKNNKPDDDRGRFRTLQTVNVRRTSSSSVFFQNLVESFRQIALAANRDTGEVVRVVRGHHTDVLGPPYSKEEPPRLENGQFFSAKKVQKTRDGKNKTKKNQK